MGRAHILRTYIIFGDIIWGYDHQWDTMFCTHFWVFNMRLMASSLYLCPWDHLKKQSWLVLISCVELICRVPLKPCFHLTTNRLHSWVCEIKFQHKLANSSSASPLIHIPATFSWSRKQSQAVATKIVSRAQKSSRDPFITVFQRGLYSSPLLFPAKGVVSHTWGHGEAKKDLKTPPGLWSSELWNLPFWSLAFLPPHHIGINAMVL